MSKHENRLSKSTFNKNSKSIKILFESIFDGSEFLSQSCHLSTEKNRTQILMRDGTVIISTCGAIHETMKPGWFIIVNNEPHYDIRASKKLAMDLQKSGKLKVTTS